jgi:hypothetical protein
MIVSIYVPWATLIDNIGESLNHTFSRLVLGVVCPPELVVIGLRRGNGSPAIVRIVHKRGGRLLLPLNSTPHGVVVLQEHLVLSDAHIGPP